MRRKILRISEATSTKNARPMHSSHAIGGSGVVPGTHPADGRLASLDVPVFYGYGTNDTVIPKFLVNETLAWLEEHTWLTAHAYRGLDHSVSLEEFADLRQWLLDQNIASGMI